MSAASAIRAGRRAAQALMVDACTIKRKTGSTLNTSPPFDYVDTFDTLYTGACRVRPPNVQDNTVEAEERLVYLRSYVVSVPVTVTGVEVDDVVTITASALDADLVGRQMRVRDVTRGSHITARRLTCEEVTA